MKIEDKEYSFEPVPQEKRNNFWKMLVVMLGFSFYSASMWAGGSLGEGLTFAQMIGVVMLGNLILGAFTGSLAYIAARTGLSTHLLAQYSFGQKGAYISSFMLSITQIGWFGVGLGMFAYPVHKVTGMPLVPLIVISGILMTSTAFFGMKALTIISFVAVPSIAILGSFSAGKAITDMGGVEQLFAYTPETSLGIAAALTITIGSFISGGTLTPDFTRYAKNSRHAVSTTVIAFFLGNTLMFLFGAIGVIATGHNDISDVMISQGIILPAIFVLGLNIWTTNDNSLYASALGFATMFKRPKVMMVLINGTISIVFALFLYNHFTTWLTFLGSTLPAIGSIIIVDYFFLKKRQYIAYGKAKIKDVNQAAVIAWAAGVIAGLTLPGVSSLNSLLVTGISYFILVKVMKTTTVTENIEEEEIIYEQVV
ncbi:cytosine permease [Gracilibacillus sp. Marseille-QA3620]